MKMSFCHRYTLRNLSTDGYGQRFLVTTVAWKKKTARNKF
jgi:hypothetical protein